MKDIFEILKAHNVEVPEDSVTEIRKAVAENYKTINEFNKKTEKLDGQLQTANNTITDLNNKIKDFENVDVKGLQDTIKKYKEDEKARKEADDKAKSLQALKDRFSPLKGDKKFLNEGTEQWIFSEFEKALALEENKGKGDAEIFESITKDKNIYENPNTKTVIPPAGNIGGKDNQRTSTLKIAILSLIEWVGSALYNLIYGKIFIKTILRCNTRCNITKILKNKNTAKAFI